MNSIEIERLTKFYGKSRGVEDVNLAVKRGEFFGFIGPNGAGKSTTIRAMLGLIRPTSGAARLLGMNVASAREREEILSRTGYLPSEVAFYPGMRARDVLRFSAELRKRDCRRAANELCERLQLDPLRRADELSLGNRRKLAIACALQHEPELLILDEPTSGLDPLTRREFFAILRERSAAGATVFLSSHLLDEVQRNCSRAAILREGHVVACDRVDALAGTGAKRVRVQGEVELGALPGVRDLRATDDSASFLYSGDLGALLSALARGDLFDLSVTEPDLEEVFLHFYAEGGAENDHLQA